MRWYSLFFIVFINAISCQRRNESVKEFGRIYSDDILLYNKTIERSAISRRGTVTYDFNYEVFGDEDTLISGIRIIAAKNERRPAYSTLTGGGPDFKYADLHFESQEGGGIHFRVLIYGYEDY